MARSSAPAPSTQLDAPTWGDLRAALGEPRHCQGGVVEVALSPEHTDDSAHYVDVGCPGRELCECQHRPFLGSSS